MADVKTPEEKAKDLLAQQSNKKSEEVATPKEEPKKEVATPKEEPEDKAILEELKKEKEIQAFNDYQKFAELYFLMWDGFKFERKRIKKEALADYDKLEKTFKASKGNKPKKSNTVVIGLGVTNVRIVEGYVVPESLYKVFVDAGKADKYF